MSDKIIMINNDNSHLAWHALYGSAADIINVVFLSGIAALLQMYHIYMYVYVVSRGLKPQY